jgi:N6-adenosine-specific RNA methylase IME4
MHPPEMQLDYAIVTRDVGLGGIAVLPDRLRHINAAVGRHSEKPDAFYELIENYFPTLPKIELNARANRVAWGNEAPALDRSAGGAA